MVDQAKSSAIKETPQRPALGNGRTRRSPGLDSRSEFVLRHIHGVCLKAARATACFRVPICHRPPLRGMERGSWLPWLVFGFNVLLSGFRFDTFDVAQLAMFKPLTFQPPHTRPHGPTLPPDRADSHARRGRYDNRASRTSPCDVSAKRGGAVRPAVQRRRRPHDQ